MKVNSHKIALGLVAAMAATVGVIMFYLFAEKSFLTYENIPFPPVVFSARPGDIVPLSVERCNHDKISHNYTTTHALKNTKTQEVVLLPEMMVNITPGCTSAISLINRIPPGTPPGHYIVFGTAETRGTLRTHYVDWHSQEFEVLPVEKNKNEVTVPLQAGKSPV
jgi:hypothetical protein